MIERRPYTFDRVVRIVFSICGLLIALYLLNVLKGVLLPFLVACLICYMLEPLVKWNQRVTHVKSRFLRLSSLCLRQCLSWVCSVRVLPLYRK